MVMILHALGHWVTVAANANGVTYTDSLRPHQPITQYIMNQLLQHIDDGKLWLSILPSTPQTNSNDCGIFAAAYATELMCGNGQSGLQSPFAVEEMCTLFAEPGCG